MDLHLFLILLVGVPASLLASAVAMTVWFNLWVEWNSYRRLHKD